MNIFVYKTKTTLPYKKKKIKQDGDIFRHGTENKIGIMWTGLTTPHFCACHKPGHVFLTSFVFDDFRIELIVHFVDIGGLADHHCLVSIYFYLPLNSKHDWYKWTVVLLVLQIHCLYISLK